MRPDQTAPAAGGIYQRVVERYVALCQRRGPWLLLLALALAVTGVALTPGIHVDARLEALLPAGTPSQRSLAELRGRAGSISPLYLVVQSPDPALNRRLSRSLQAAVKRWPETRQVLNRRDPTYFLQRRLLFLPATAIDDLTRQVQQRLGWEECRAAPGCENLETRPPRPDLEVFQRRYAEDPTVRALLSLVGAKQAPRPGAPRREHNGRRLGELCAADGSICVVQADLKGQPSDLTYATRIEMLEKRIHRLEERFWTPKEQKAARSFLIQKVAGASLRFALNLMFGHGHTYGYDYKIKRSGVHRISDKMANDPQYQKITDGLSSASRLLDRARKVPVQSRVQTEISKQAALLTAAAVRTKLTKRQYKKTTRRLVILPSKRLKVRNVYSSARYNQRKIERKIDDLGKLTTTVTQQEKDQLIKRAETSLKNFHRQLVRYMKQNRSQLIAVPKGQLVSVNKLNRVLKGSNTMLQRAQGQQADATKAHTGAALTLQAYGL